MCRYWKRGRSKSLSMLILLDAILKMDLGVLPTQALPSYLYLSEAPYHDFCITSTILFLFDIREFCTGLIEIVHQVGNMILITKLVTLTLGTRFRVPFSRVSRAEDNPIVLGFWTINTLFWLS